MGTFFISRVATINCYFSRFSWLKEISIEKLLTLLIHSQTSSLSSLSTSKRWILIVQDTLKSIRALPVEFIYPYLPKFSVTSTEAHTICKGVLRRFFFVFLISLETPYFFFVIITITHKFCDIFQIGFHHAAAKDCLKTIAFSAEFLLCSLLYSYYMLTHIS